jgi:IS605 OrfB family transposase
MTCRYRFLVLLKKPPPTLQVTENVVGVDQNSNGVAVTVMNRRSGRILKQLYLGRDISLWQIRYENRRAVLQEYRDEKGHRGKAGLKLRQLSGRQRNYVRTNTRLLAKQLTDLATQHKATIAIERLYKLRREKGQLSRKSRRKTNRIPYGFLRHALAHKSAQLGILLSKCRRGTQAKHVQDADASAAKTAGIGDTSGPSVADSRRMRIVSQA